MTASQAENLDSQVHHQIPAMKEKNHGVYYSRISMHSNQCRIFAEKKLKINVKKGRRFDRSTVIFKFRSKKKLACAYREFSHDVTAAILVFQENPLGGELFSHVNAFFCSKKLA